jgi:ABC-2 type transport system permease protein
VTASGHFKLYGHLGHDRDATALLDRGKVRVVVKIEHGYSQQLRLGENTVVQVLLDGSDSNTAGVVMGYLGRLSMEYNTKLQADFSARRYGAAPRIGQVQLASRAWFNENLDSPPFYVPAVITNILFVITMLLSSLAVVREKEVGTIEQVVVTPIRKSEFILGKTLPFVLIGYIDVALISGASALVFNVPVRGSLWLLFAATTLFLMSSLGMGC